MYKASFEKNFDIFCLNINGFLHFSNKEKKLICANRASIHHTVGAQCSAGNCIERPAVVIIAIHLFRNGMSAQKDELTCAIRVE